MGSLHTSPTGHDPRERRELAQGHTKFVAKLRQRLGLLGPGEQRSFLNSSSFHAVRDYKGANGFMNSRASQGAKH